MFANGLYLIAESENCSNSSRTSLIENRSY